VKNKRKEGWSQEELKASVEAYLDMQRKKSKNQSFVKTEYYQQLSERFGRTKKSIEYRMQNISYVFATLGKEWLPGLKPAKNVGTRVAAIIEKLLFENDEDKK
jgi:5-methylcytosine-specific restriction protein A